MQENGIKNYEPNEDEIDLHEVVKTIWNQKVFIVLFSFTITFMTIIYLLSIPNIYDSKALLVPQNEKGGGLGGLSAMASFAGVNVGEAQMTPDQAYQSLLKDYSFMRSFVLNNNLTDIYFSEDLSKNYVFALGMKGLYDLTHFAPESHEEDPERDIYEIVKKLQRNMSISSDKKSGLITISYQDPDRLITQKLLHLFLEQSSHYLIENKLETINRKLNYYQDELATTEEFELRKNISALISKLVEEKITIKSSRYFQTELLTKPEVAYMKNKVGPKRVLILIGIVIASLFIAIFIVLIRETVFGNKKESINIT